MTGVVLASVKTVVAQKATVHKDIALNEGIVISLAFLTVGLYKVSETYFKSKTYDGRKITGPCVIL
jgi:hypothetical protein